jgi:ATP-dependent RNA helicase DDX27
LGARPGEITTLFHYNAHRVTTAHRAGRKGCACTIADDGPRTRDMMKQVVAHARSAVKKRVVAVDAVELWQAKLLAYEGELEKIKEEEVVERHLALAEMEAAKAHNMLRHEDEIKAKPRRTWFQSEKEKAEVKKSGKGGAAEQEGDGQEGAGEKRFRAVDPKQLNKYSGMSRDKRRRLILQGDDPRELKTLGKVAPVKGAKELGREAKAEAKVSKKKDRTGFDFEKQGKGPRADKERKIVKPLKRGELKRSAVIEKRPDRRPEHKKGPKSKPSNKSFKSKGRHKRR